MRGLFLGGVIGLVGVFAGPTVIQAKEREPVILAPSTPWQIDYAEEKCRLVRVFGEGEARHVLFFEQGAPGRSFGMTAAGPSFDLLAGPIEIGATFGKSTITQAANPYIGNVEKIGTAVIFTYVTFAPINEQLPDSGADKGSRPGLSSVDAAFASSLDSVTIVGKWRAPITFATGEMGNPMAALNHCAFDLVSSWGLDAEALRNASRNPKWTNQNQVTRRIAATYPKKAKREGEIGFFRMRVMIDEGGTVTDCHLEEASQLVSLESPACKEMMRATFEPALDAQGKPIRSFYATTVSYIL